MKNNYIYNSEFSNIYERPNINSNVSTQILFGENFSILKKSRNFYKIKIDTDNYVGFIKKLKLFNKYRTSHKIYVLKSKIYKLSKENKFTYTGKDLPFASKIQILNKYKSYLMFKKNFWIRKDDVKTINHKIKNFIYASSSSIYGNSNKSVFRENDNATSPIQLYAATKRSNELLSLIHI